MRRGVGPGGSEGVGPPLESGIYRVKIIFKKISYLYGPPLKKICSLAPEHFHCFDLPNRPVLPLSDKFDGALTKAGRINGFLLVAVR